VRALDSVATVSGRRSCLSECCLSVVEGVLGFCEGEVVADGREVVEARVCMGSLHNAEKLSK
jgi:hypothetical protein